MPKRRVLAIGPHAGAVRRDDQQTPVVLQHAPDLTQQTAGVLRHLQTMHQQDAVEGQIGERQMSSSAAQDRLGTPGGQRAAPICAGVSAMQRVA